MSYIFTSAVNIETFMSFYRDSFPHATVTPKLHMLEDHVVHFLSKWKVGFGFMGEQGAESIHARFKTKLRQHAKSRTETCSYTEHSPHSSLSPQCSQETWSKEEKDEE